MQPWLRIQEIEIEILRCAGKLASCCLPTEDEKGKKLASESVFHYVLKLDGLGEARMFYREYFLT